LSSGQQREDGRGAALASLFCLASLMFATGQACSVPLICASLAHRTWPHLLTGLAQLSMQFTQQVSDPLGHCFGNLGPCQFAGDSCLDFFNDQLLAR
jgi:hypothetical protein